MIFFRLEGMEGFLLWGGNDVFIWDFFVFYFDWIIMVGDVWMVDVCRKEIGIIKRVWGGGGDSG